MGESEGGSGMREILFRGKTIKTRFGGGKWIEGFYAMSCAGRAEMKPAIITGTERSCFITEFVDPATVGQFTGLYDKNGVKIFEGDKVESGCGEIGIIEYLEEDGMFIISFPITSGHSSWIATFGDFDGKEMAVIDNIHDNFELLKEESV
jgi:uncharacterized phage protein (TIGR01671 family)